MSRYVQLYSLHPERHRRGEKCAKPGDFPTCRSLFLSERANHSELSTHDTASWFSTENCHVLRVLIIFFWPVVRFWQRRRLSRLWFRALILIFGGGNQNRANCRRPAHNNQRVGKIIRQLRRRWLFLNKMSFPPPYDRPPLLMLLCEDLRIRTS